MFRVIWRQIAELRIDCLARQCFKKKVRQNFAACSRAMFCDVTERTGIFLGKHICSIGLARNLDIACLEDLQETELMFISINCLYCGNSISFSHFIDQFDTLASLKVLKLHFEQRGYAKRSSLSAETWLKLFSLCLW